MTDTEYKDLIDRELDRLHKLIEAGKEAQWATHEVSRIMAVIFSPPIMIPESSNLANLGKR